MGRRRDGEGNRSFLDKALSINNKNISQDNDEIDEDVTKNKNLLEKSVGRFKSFFSDTMQVLFDVKTSSIPRIYKPDTTKIWRQSATDMKLLDPTALKQNYVPKWEETTSKINTFEQLCKYGKGDDVNRFISTTTTPALKRNMDTQCHLCSKVCSPGSRARIHFAPREKTQLSPDRLAKINKKQSGRKANPNDPIRDKPHVGYFCKDHSASAMSLALWQYPLYTLDIYMPNREDPVVCRDWDLDAGVERQEIPHFFPYSVMVGCDDEWARDALIKLDEESWVNTCAEDIEQRFNGFGFNDEVL